MLSGVFSGLGDLKLEMANRRQALAWLVWSLRHDELDGQPPDGAGGADQGAVIFAVIEWHQAYSILMPKVKP